jgi:hypothetical protein
MTHEDFARLLESRIAKIKRTLSEKAVEYASKDDRLHSFSDIGLITGNMTKEVWMVLFAKHLVSIVDMIKSKENFPGQAWIDEKIGDAINYLILLEAIFAEDGQE